MSVAVQAATQDPVPAPPAEPPPTSPPPSMYVEQAVAVAEDTHTPSTWSCEGDGEQSVPMYVSVHEGITTAANTSFGERAEALKQHATARLQQMETSQAKSTECLAEELRKHQEKIRLLEDERAQMRQGMVQLKERLEAAERALQTGGWPVPAIPPAIAPECVAMPPGLAATAPAPPGLQPGADPFSPGALPPGLGAPPIGSTARAALAAVAAAAAGYPPLPTFPLLAAADFGTPGGAEAGAAAAPKPPSAGAGPEPPVSPPGLQPSSPVISLAESCPLPAGCLEELPPGMRSPAPTRRSSLSTQAAPLTPKLVASPQRARNTTPGPGNRGVPGTPPRTPQQRTPRHSGGFGTPYGLKSPAVPASPFVHCEGGGCVFGFMLRLAAGVEVGLDIAYAEGGQSLLVKGVVPGGAIEAWNKQCVGGPAAGKAVATGDKVVQVNSATDVRGMLAEFKEKQMLRLTVVRGDPDVDVWAVWVNTPQRTPGNRTRFSLGAASTASGQESSPCPEMPASPSLNPVAAEFVPGTVSVAALLGSP